MGAAIISLSVYHRHVLFLFWATENEILQVLNDGTIKDLKRLQGVGHKRAQLVLNWRTIHGPFQQVQDLKLIDGFTDKMVTSFLKNNLLSRITFS